MDTRALAACWLAGAGVSLGGCFSIAPNASFNVTPLHSQGSGSGASFALVSIQGVAPPAFSTGIVASTSVSAAFFNSTSLTFKVSCAAGMAGASVTINSVTLDGPFDCPPGGGPLTFTAPFALGLSPVSIAALAPGGGSLSGAQVIEQQIYVKTSAPPPVVVSGASPSSSVSSPYFVSPGTISIDGTVTAAPTDYVTGVLDVTDSSGKVSYNSGAGTLTELVPVAAGQSTTNSLVSVDLAGNRSAATVVSLTTGDKALVLNAAAAGSPAPIASVNTLVAFTSAPALQAPATQPDSTLYVGLGSDDDAEAP